ncbi:hypothetical protein [Hahella ganghwensis]|uniref:hypothetical protein n=1 Tax=Hahella ganghwensis TaxID=286420 RepID=UPI00037C23C0|nr:hypothetical protein [Hahella ganghwensis]
MNWETLQHAYGNASDIPGLLAPLREYPKCEDYEDEPFFSLWSRLCHQGDVYSASYAAVIQIVSALVSDPEKADFNYFLLPICIEISRLKGNGPDIPKEIESEYHSSVDQLVEVAAKVEMADELTARVLSAALAVRHGQVQLAEAILELSPDVLADFHEWIQER